MEYTLIKSKRKSVALEISTEGNLIVRAPLNFTEKDAGEFINKNKKWIFKHLPSILDKKEEISKLCDKEILLAKKSIKIICSHLIEKYAPLMDVYPKNIKITSAKKRFGSCSTKNNICFSYLLILYPIEAITYVIVHELAHIKHHNHSVDFHNYIKKFLPQSKNYEKLLHPTYAKYENFLNNIKFTEEIK